MEEGMEEGMEYGEPEQYEEVNERYEFLKKIGVDSRFVSFYQKDSIDHNAPIDDTVKLYIENLRFSKFSKTRTVLFNKYYPDIEVVRSSLFQKICARASKTLANGLNPQDTVIIPPIDNPYNELLYIVLEPYSRKYGISFIEYDENVKSEDFDSVISPLNLNQEVNHILNDI